MPTLPYFERKQKPFTGVNQENYEIYNSPQWRKTSHAFRKRNPLCIECLKEGRTVQATTTDHIIPISEGGKIWDWNNLQSLCKHHNAIKTAKQRNQARNGAQLRLNQIT